MSNMWKRPKKSLTSTGPLPFQSPLPEAPVEPAPKPPPNDHAHNGHHNKSSDTKSSKPQFVFHCQQAQGSPTGLISGFSSIKELYQKIAECYDFPAEQILFCTLNTHKPDMNHLLGGQIALNDFIFVHRKGQAKEIELQKLDEALGLTITDNGAGYCFIKKIREGSIIEKLGHISVGDHIEKINKASVIGKRHVEVAKLLKDIPKGSTFSMRLVEPLKDGLVPIGPRTSQSTGKLKPSGNGYQTIRFKQTGPATVEQAPDDAVAAAIEGINKVLDTFMGINDEELATQIWEIGTHVKNPIDLTEEFQSSELAALEFTDDFLMDCWGVISDAKAGRLQRRR